MRRPLWMLALSTILSIGRSLSSVPPSSSASISSPPTHLFIGGLGYCGIRIAKVFHEAYPECKISGSVRSKERQAAMASQYSEWLHVHVLDLDETYSGLDEDRLLDLSSASHVIQTVAPIADFDRDPLLALHQNVLSGDEENANHNLQWIGYISSTGVYGDHQGEWVDENSDLHCTDRKSVARVQAEQDWGLLEKDDKGMRVDCFRCGGIHGPGRSPLFALMKEQQAIQKTTTSSSSTFDNGPPKYVNRILVDDLCGALLAAVSSDRPRMQGGKKYNLVDDDPAPRREVAKEARRLLGMEENVETSGSGDATTTTTPNSRRSRNTGNKRCKNQRLKDDYGWQMEAPTFREGLAILMEN